MALNHIQAHEKIKGMEWDFSYAEPRAQFQTTFHIPKKGKDPFRHLIRDYMTMEAEKDDRQYGFLDGAVRMNNPNQAEERWVEGMKVFCAAFPYPEYTAMKAQGQLINAVDNQELRQGYLAQMLDEVRHYQQEIYLGRYFLKHYHDPAGFEFPMKALGNNTLATAVRAASETFISGDPIEGQITLQVVGETTFTNPLFVSLPRAAAANGDHAVPSVFLSIQSDESRHMANGYATLVTLLDDSRNVPLIQEAMDKAFWRVGVFVDSAVAMLTEYYTVNKTEAYKDVWQHWIIDDWVNSYIGRLEKFGLKPPRWLDLTYRNIQWRSHTTAMFLHASWPLMFWRFDTPNARDMEWLEKHYTGWHSHYGKFWEEYERRSDPANGALSMNMFPSIPPTCQVCLFPCIFPRPDISDVRIKEYNGRKLAFCSDACDWIFHLEPERYLGHVQFYEKFDGWSLADVIRHLGYLRADGKTLTAQPSLRKDRMWTIQDIERIGYEIKNPLRD
ncbi:MAG: YHS domain-containing protein [Candidatus Binatia bacterium]